jgi:hypothetical protein
MSNVTNPFLWDLCSAFLESWNTAGESCEFKDKKNGKERMVAYMECPWEGIENVILVLRLSSLVEISVMVIAISILLVYTIETDINGHVVAYR